MAFLHVLARADWLCRAPVGMTLPVLTAVHSRVSTLSWGISRIAVTAVLMWVVGAVHDSCELLPQIV